MLKSQRHKKAVVHLSIQMQLERPQDPIGAVNHLAAPAQAQAQVAAQVAADAHQIVGAETLAHRVATVPDHYIALGAGVLNVKDLLTTLVIIW